MRFGLDCEMVYTTAGMSIARVSVVDGSGKEVFDELIRLDDGVDLMYEYSFFVGTITHHNTYQRL
jgi:RNA exonuclease 1